MGFQYRGCTLGASLRNDAAIRILAQEKSGSGQERSLLDSPCALCETTTPEICITNYNIELQVNARLLLQM